MIPDDIAHINTRNNVLALLLTACLGSSATAGNSVIYFSTLESNTDAISDLVNSKETVATIIKTPTTSPNNEGIPAVESFVQSDLKYNVRGQTYTVMAKLKILNK